MYLRDLVASMIRRWYFIVTGVLLTGVLGFLAFSFVPVTYQASGSVLLLPPKSSVGARGNPSCTSAGSDRQRRCSRRASTQRMC